MKTPLAIALVLVPLLSSCGREAATSAQKTKSEQSLAEYAKSSKGRREMALSQEKAAAARPGGITRFPASQTERTKRSMEGVWSSMPSRDGTVIRASFSRDGLATMEEIDRNGGSSNFAQGSITVKGARISGTLTNARKSLKPFDKWTLSRQSDTSAFLMGNRKIVPISKGK